MELTKSNRNKNKILYEGYVYVKQKDLADEWKSFECERRRRYRDCSGKIHVKNDIVRVKNQHTHAPDLAKREAYKVTAAIKERAQTTLDKPQQIVGNSLVGITDAVAAELPTIPSIRQNIRRQRKDADVLLPVPGSRADLPHPIPDQYTTTSDGLPFLRYDSGDQDRILIFVTDAKLNFLKNSNDWFIDGTFDSVPLIYTQLLTIHAKIEGKVLQCVFILLPNKTQVCYTTVFRQLRRIDQDLNPTSILIDFEIAIKNGLGTVFPGVLVSGCYFHFTQNIWRKVQASWLQVRYQNDVDFVTEVRMIAALAFVPENDVERFFNLLSNNIDADLDVILDYIEENYIGAISRGRYRLPRFQYSMWGVCNRVLNNLPRTNNAVEGWHNRFNRHVGCHHANIWKIINILKQEDDLSQVELLHIQQGRAVANPNPVYTRINDRVSTVVESYANREPLDYLRGIAYNITV